MHDSLVASVMDGSVYLLEFGANVPIRIKKEYKGHTKGVFCSAWSNHFNFLATGGMDRAVLLWTPYNENPLAALTGHATSVSRLIINDKDAHIISMRCVLRVPAHSVLGQWALMS